ncbi:MAG: peptide deformylase [Chloroflexota bacterium]
MAILDIVLEGDPRLRQKALKIRAVDESIRRLARDMHETMDAAPGVGLAGPQVGVMRRIIVVHVPEGYQGEDEPEIRMTLVNPEILKAQGREIDTEGCLSIPGWVGDVPRAQRITVRAMDLDNRVIRFKAEGFLARVIQHEVDHLDGILFIDRVEDPTTLRRVTEAEEALVE